MLARLNILITISGIKFKIYENFNSYQSQPENFRINEISEFFAKNEVEVLTGVPNYPEGEIYNEFKLNPEKFNNYKNAKIHRINNRPRYKGKKIDLFFNYLSFFIRAIFFSFFKLKKKNYDLIFSFGTSPVTNSLIGVLSKFTNSKINMGIRFMA